MNDNQACMNTVSGFSGNLITGGKIMNNHGIYIYGIINSGMNKFIANYSTEEGDKIYGFSYQDISAILDNSRIFDYSNLPKDILARKLLKHQTTIEEIMNFGSTIIPMKLGTLVSSENEVRDILVKGYTLTKEIFKKIEDKIEIDLAVTWNDLNSVLKGLGEGEVIKELKEKILAESQEITIENKIKIGTIVKNELDKIREIISSEISACLKEYSSDIKIHPLMNDTMIANFAFLIEKRKLEEFERKLETLNTDFSGKLNFRSVGPLPPYSFYTLEIKKILNKDLDWATKKLRLKNSRISKDEVKKAYKSSAFACHPDKNTYTPDSEKEFDEVNKAYKILNEYCLACEQTNHGENKFYDIEKFDNSAILVKVKD
ncbi:GvpL/GvpF family gas vesicle protein [Patescibacteria group bacterium]|nr:GvpL/GvpF family gas vesicle protein [Patescibacteria group bacterium]